MEEDVPDVPPHPQSSRADAIRSDAAPPDLAVSGPGAPPVHDRRITTVLSVCNFLSKGWEVGILGLLVFLQQEYRFPLYLVGILSTVFLVTQIGISLFAGKIAHAIRSRNVVLLAISASGFGWLTLSLAHSVPALFLAYGLAGAASGLYEPIGVSLVARHSAANSRSQAIGDYAAFGDMGRIAIVAAATALAGWFGVNHACAILLLTNVAAFILAAAFLAKPDPATEPGATETRVPLRELLNVRNFRYASLAGMADSFSSSSLYIFIPFLLTAKGISLADTLYFNVIFFAGYLAGRVFLGRIADRRGAPRTLILSEAMMAALVLALTAASGIVIIVILLFLLGIFTRGTSPIIRAMVADSLPEGSSFHDAFGTYSFASRGAGAVSRPIYGFLASPNISMVFYVASAVALLTLYPASRYAQKRQ